MCWNKKILRPVIIVIVVIVVTVLLCLLQYAIQYYNEPIKKDIHINDTGILIYNTNPITYEVVDVELKGKEFHYLFNNQEDGIYGNVWIDRTIDGKTDRIYLFGYENGDDKDLDFRGGFYVEFYEKYDDLGWVNISSNSDSETPGNMFLTSKDMQTIICGVDVTEDIADKSKENKGTQALLVFHAEDIDTANEIISEVASVWYIENWLLENGWNQYVE